MDMAADAMGTTCDECYGTNSPWLRTMAYCIQQHCDIDGYCVENQAKCFSNQAVAGASKPTFQESLPDKPPTVELAEYAMWLNVTSLVNSNTCYATHGTLKEFARSEYIHTRYSYVLLHCVFFKAIHPFQERDSQVTSRVMLYLMVIGICIGSGILSQTESVVPGLQQQLHASTLWTKLQQHIFLPTLFGSRHLEPLPGNIGYIPSRILSIIIGVFVVMNVIISSVSFRSFSPNTWFASNQFEMCEYVGNRTGTLSLVNMSLAILFAGRNNILIAVTGWSQTTFLTLHRWTARVAALQAVVHSITYTVAYFEPGSGGAAGYAAQAAKTFYVCISILSTSSQLSI
jgi:hypothetical protein